MTATIEDRIENLDQQLRFQQSEVTRYRLALQTAKHRCAQVEGAIAALRGLLEAGNGAVPPEGGEP